MMVMGADPHRGQRGMRTSLVVSVVEVGRLQAAPTRQQLAWRAPVAVAAKPPRLVVDRHGESFHSGLSADGGRRGCPCGFSFSGPLDRVLLAAVLDPARAATRAEGAPLAVDDDGDVRGRAQRAAWHGTPPGKVMGGSVSTSGR